MHYLKVILDLHIGLVLRTPSQDITRYFHYGNDREEDNKVSIQRKGKLMKFEKKEKRKNLMEKY